MLGPNDLRDWGDEELGLRTVLRTCPQYFRLKKEPDLAALPGHDAALFTLAQRFGRDEWLESHDLIALARAWSL